MIVRALKNLFLSKKIEKREKDLLNLRTSYESKDYLDNIYNYWFPSDQFINTLHLKMTGDFELYEFEDLIDVNNLKNKNDALIDRGLFDDTISFYKSNFPRFKELLFTNCFNHSNLNYYVESGFHGPYNRLRSHIHSQLHNICGEPVAMVNSFIGIAMENPLYKQTIGKDIIHIIIDQYFKKIKINENFGLYVSSEDRIKIIYSTIVKKLAIDLKKLPPEESYNLLKDELFNINCEQVNLKTEGEYLSTLSDYQESIEKLFYEYQRKLTNSNIPPKPIKTNKTAHNDRNYFILNPLVNQVHTREKKSYRIKKDKTFLWNGYKNNPNKVSNILHQIYKDLLKEELIDKDTSFIDFKAIFTGKVKKKISWTGNKTSLIYFIYLLLSKYDKLKGKHYFNKIRESFTFSGLEIEDSLENKDSFKTIMSQVKDEYSSVPGNKTLLKFINIKQHLQN